MIEAQVEKHLIERVEAVGGITAKMTVAGRVGWPDRLVVLPGREPQLVEVKRPGGRLSTAQKALHERLGKLDVPVVVIRSIADVDRWLVETTNRVVLRVDGSQPTGDTDRDIELAIAMLNLAVLSIGAAYETCPLCLLYALAKLTMQWEEEASARGRTLHRPGGSHTTETRH